MVNKDEDFALTDEQLATMTGGQFVVTVTREVVRDGFRSFSQYTIPLNRLGEWKATHPESGWKISDPFVANTKEHGGT
jgi:hypothetical protein